MARSMSHLASLEGTFCGDVVVEIEKLERVLSVEPVNLRALHRAALKVAFYCDSIMEVRSEMQAARAEAARNEEDTVRGMVESESGWRKE